MEDNTLDCQEKFLNKLSGKEPDHLKRHNQRSYTAADAVISVSQSVSPEEKQNWFTCSLNKSLS